MESRLLDVIKSLVASIVSALLSLPLQGFPHANAGFGSSCMISLRSSASDEDPFVEDSVVSDGTGLLWTTSCDGTEEVSIEVDIVGVDGC